MSWWTLGKHFLLPAGCGNSFSAKTCRGAWGSGCWLVRGHVNMAEAKLCTQFVLFWSLGCTACGQALPWRRIGPLLFTSAGCRHCSFRCISLICWAYILDVMVSPGFRKLWWTRLAADHGSVFGAGLALGSVLRLLHCSATGLVVTCCIKSTFHRTSQSGQEMVCCCVE